MPDLDPVGPDGQLPLLNLAQLPGADVGAYNEHTGALLLRRDPERAQEILRLTAQGIGTHAIARILRVAPATVIAIRRAYPAEVEREKQRIGRRAMLAAELSIDRLTDDLIESADRISARDKAIIAGVLVDKGQLLLGEATQRIEHVDSRPAHDDWLAMVRSAQAETQKGAAVEGVIEAEETGNG